MEMMIERRGDLTGRVPLHLPIELEFAGIDEPFEADAVDISTGGLALRTASLPAVGTLLSCRFAAEPVGAPIVAEGEVVWSRLDGPRGGEFGLRFMDISAEQRALIGEMIAELEAHGSWRSMDSKSRAAVRPNRPVVLTLDAGDAEIEGCLSQRSAEGARFEQPLALLEVGQGLWLQDDDGTERHAHITGVSLRVEGKTPLLAVQVAFDNPELSAKSELAVSGRDTVPDMEAPELRFQQVEDESVHTRPTLSGEDLAQMHEAHDSLDEASLSWPSAAPQAREDRTPVRGGRAHAPIQVELPLEEPAAEEPPRAPSFALPVENALSQPSNDSRRGHHQTEAGSGREDVSLCFQVSGDEMEGVRDTCDGPKREKHSAQSNRTDFRAALDSSPLFQQGGPVLRVVAYAARLTAQARQVTSRISEVELGKIGQRLSAAVVAVRATAFPPKRRTVGKARRDGTMQRVGRRLPLMAMGLMAMTGLALLAYALTPEPDPLLRTDAQPGLPHSSVQSRVVAPIPSAAPPPAAAPAPAPVIAPPVAAAPAVAVLASPPSVVPANSPYAVDVHEQPAPVPAPAAHPDAGPHFGAARVANARTFTLHMTSDIKELRGVPDQGGFSVVIPGALSLDRAGPIAAAHVGVQRAMILNKGDRAELTIRFEEGKKPSYRVSAKGSELHVELGR